MKRQLIVESKRSSKEVLLSKYKLALNNPIYGIMTGMTAFSIMFYKNLIFREDFNIQLFFTEMMNHIPASVVSIVFPIGLIASFYSIYKENKMEFEDKSYLHTWFCFSDNGILVVNDTEQKYKWNEVREVEESKGEFVIYLVDKKALTIPKKDLSLDDKLERLKSFFINKVDRKKLFLKKRLMNKKSA